MSAPITWKNVNQPNFAAANSLLLGSTRDMGDAFSSLSDRFIDQGEFNKERNTDEAVAAASQLQNLDTFGSTRQDAMQALLGKNIDQTAVAAAYDDRRGFLQDNVSFAQERDAADFAAENRQELFNIDRDRTLAATAGSQAQTAESQQRFAAAAYALTPEGKKEQSDALLAKRKHEEKLKKITAKGKFSSKGKYDFRSVIDRTNYKDIFPDASDNDVLAFRAMSQKLHNQDGQYTGTDGIKRVATADQLDAALQQYLDRHGTWFGGTGLDDTDINSDTVMQYLDGIVDSAPLDEKATEELNETAALKAQIEAMKAAAAAQ